MQQHIQDCLCEGSVSFSVVICHFRLALIVFETFSFNSIVAWSLFYFLSEARIKNDGAVRR